MQESDTDSMRAVVSAFNFTPECKDEACQLLGLSATIASGTSKCAACHASQTFANSTVDHSEPHSESQGKSHFSYTLRPCGLAPRVDTGIRPGEAGHLPGALDLATLGVVRPAGPTAKDFLSQQQRHSTCKRMSAGRNLQGVLTSSFLRPVRSSIPATVKGDAFLTSATLRSTVVLHPCRPCNHLQRWSRMDMGAQPWPSHCTDCRPCTNQKQTRFPSLLSWTEPPHV